MIFKGKTALVTGASRGFGAAISLALAGKGAHVVAVARTVGALESLDDAVQKAGGNTTLVPLDITDEPGVQRLCQSIHDRWGGLALWVHCAIHAPPLSPADHIDCKDFDKSLNTNIRATQRLIYNIAPLLQAENSIAVNLDDPCTGSKFFAAYAAAKAAQRALFDSWTAENRHSGPRIISFTPDPMPTATRARFFPGEDRSTLKTPASQANRLINAI